LRPFSNSIQDLKIVAKSAGDGHTIEKSIKTPLTWHGDFWFTERERKHVARTSSTSFLATLNRQKESLEVPVIECDSSSVIVPVMVRPSVVVYQVTVEKIPDSGVHLVLRHKNYIDCEMHVHIIRSLRTQGSVIGRD
jgi:hypothetical protein